MRFGMMGSIRSMPLVKEGSRKVTIILGICTRHAALGEALANAQLFEATHSGRNRVVNPDQAQGDKPNQVQKNSLNRSTLKRLTATYLRCTKKKATRRWPLITRERLLLKLPQPDACTKSVQCWRLQRSRLPMHLSVQSACEAAGCSARGQT